MTPTAARPGERQEDHRLFDLLDNLIAGPSFLAAFPTR
jgi:hypothetical protein